MDHGYHKKVGDGNEMEQIDLFYADLMRDYPAEKLRVWNSLREQMPSWKELHEKYGN